MTRVRPGGESASPNPPPLAGPTALRMPSTYPIIPTWQEQTRDC